MERFFLKVIDNTKNKIFKTNSDMINLIGSSKENFYKLLELMHYKRKIIKGNKEDFFIYQPRFKKSKVQSIVKKPSNDNPFKKLSEIRF